MSSPFISVDALKQPALLIEQAYCLGPGPSPYSPLTLIDSGTPGDGQSASMLSASNTFAFWQYAGALYKMVARQQVPRSLQILKSLDDGTTWTVLDEANAPDQFRGSGYFDDATATVYTAYLTLNTPGVPIALKNFDLVTETWSAAYGTAGAPTGASMATVVLRPDGTLLVMTNGKNADPTVSAITGIAYDILLDTWTAPFDIGANLYGLAGWNAALTSARPSFASQVMDSTGVVHFFFDTTSSIFVPTWSGRVFHQAVNLDNTLGSFTDFPGQVAPFPPAPYNTQQLVIFSGPAFGTPVIVGDNLLLPVSVRNDLPVPFNFPRQVAQLYVGTPVSAPVWTLDTSEYLDPEVLTDEFLWLQEAPRLATDGITIYAAFPMQAVDGQNFARIRLCQTTNVASPAEGWSAETAFDLQVDAPPGFNSAGQSLIVPMVFVGLSGAPVVPECNAPPTAKLFAPYEHTFTATGGVGPMVYEILAPGGLPNGLHLDGTTGEVSGTPVKLGYYTFDLMATDSLGATGTSACSITVAGTIPQPIVGGVGGMPYDVILGNMTVRMQVIDGMLRNGCGKPNRFDDCLLEEMRRWRRITFPDLCVIPCEYRNELPWPIDGEWGATPWQAVRVNKAGGIVTPTTASGNNVVVSWRVPTGFDGILTGIYFGYTGSGFTQGSGDIVTRVRINQRYVKDLGNSLYLLGSPQLPLPLTQGQILLSGMKVDAVVEVPNIGGGIQIGTSRIFAGLLGFLWPRG